MRVVVATVQVPFIQGGAEAHALGLCQALTQAGHEVEMVRIPFKWYPPERILEHALACRLLDLSESNGVRIDRLIALKFPAYLLPHPNKIIWLLHQHRSAYELWDAPWGSDLMNRPCGLSVRQAIWEADRAGLREAQSIYANSSRVAERLWHYCRIPARVLYHPPPEAETFYWQQPEPFFFYPSRLTPIKRQELVVEALSFCRHPVRVVFCGAPDNPAYEKELEQKVLSLRMSDRAHFLGRVTEEKKRQLYASCLGVIFPPFDEDYGYVTLEAMLSSKPVITCRDSGGPLELVRDGETGFVVEPTPEGLAVAMDRLWEDPALACKLGRAGRQFYDTLDISWEKVVAELTQP